MGTFNTKGFWVAFLYGEYARLRSVPGSARGTSLARSLSRRALLARDDHSSTRSFVCAVYSLAWHRRWHSQE